MKHTGEAQRKWNSFGFRVPKPIVDPPPLETDDLPPLPVVETETDPDPPAGELYFD